MENRKRVFVDQINEEIIIFGPSQEEAEFILDGILKEIQHQEGGAIDFRIKKGYLHLVYGAKSITQPSYPIAEVTEIVQEDSNYSKAFAALFRYFDGGADIHLHFATLSILRDLALNQQAPDIVREVVRTIEARLDPAQLSRYF